MNLVNEVRLDVGKEQIAIDVKTLRHSFDGEKHTALIASPLGVNHKDWCFLNPNQRVKRMKMPQSFIC